MFEHEYVANRHLPTASDVASGGLGCIVFRTAANRGGGSFRNAFKPPQIARMWVSLKYAILQCYLERHDHLHGSKI